MNEQKRKERNTQRVKELWPSFGNKIKAVIADLAQEGSKYLLHLAAAAEAQGLVTGIR